MTHKGDEKIFIWGMPSSGKSTVGKLLASAKGIRHYDLDERIVEGTGISVETWFAKYGEKAFREVESIYLKELIELPGCFVISCGGGTPCFEENARSMNECGVTFFLDVPNEELVNRLTSLGELEKRPLLTKDSSISVFRAIDEMSKDRRGHYHSAYIRIISPGLTSVKQIVATLAGFLD